MPSRQNKEGIHILALGETPAGAEERAGAAVSSTFSLKCAILVPEKRPDFSRDDLREQYRAWQVLDYLDERFSEGERMVLAITPVDLFIPALTFVFGEAHLAGSSGVISTFRLREEYYGRRPDRGLLLSRVEKTAIHEVGHLLGLTHCLDRNCVMHASNSLADTDVKSTSLCPHCHARWEHGGNHRPPG